MRKFIVSVFVLLLSTASSIQAEEREYIYGAELMSPKERDSYRRGLKDSQSDEAKGEYRQRHRERLQRRAQQRGVQLDDKGLVRREGGRQ